MDIKSSNFSVLFKTFLSPQKGTVVFNLDIWEEKSWLKKTKTNSLKLNTKSSE